MCATAGVPGYNALPGTMDTIPHFDGLDTKIARGLDALMENCPGLYANTDGVKRSKSSVLTHVMTFF